MDTLITALTALTTALTGLLPAWNTTAKALEKQASSVQLPKLKPKQPNIFDGNQQQVNGFIAELKFYFHALKIEDHMQMIVYVLSKIRGGKEDITTHWANQQQLAITAASEETPSRQYYPTYNEFKKALIEYFAIRDTAGDAIEAITLLEQGDKTADEYLVMFKSYSIHSGYNEPALLREYKRGLNHQLREKVGSSWPIPKTLEDWQKRSCESDRAWRVERKTQKKTR